MAKEDRCIAVPLLRRNQQNMTIAVPLQQPAGQSITARAVSWVEEMLNNMETAGLLW